MNTTFQKKRTSILSLLVLPAGYSGIQDNLLMPSGRSCAEESTKEIVTVLQYSIPLKDVTFCSVAMVNSKAVNGNSKEALSPGFTDREVLKRIVLLSLGRKLYKR